MDLFPCLYTRLESHVLVFLSSGVPDVGISLDSHLVVSIIMRRLLSRPMKHPTDFAFSLCKKNQEKRKNTC